MIGMIKDLLWTVIYLIMLLVYGLQLMAPGRGYWSTQDERIEFFRENKECFERAPQ